MRSVMKKSALLFSAVCVFPALAIAQGLIPDDPSQIAEVVEVDDYAADGTDYPEVETIGPVDMKRKVPLGELTSVLFTFWEHNAILDAKRARGLARPPTEDELFLSEDGDEKLERQRPPPEERELALGGLLYTSANDWTIWLNGKRITPNALPREVIELRVHKNYIEVKWLDDYTKRIYPVRLRAHQRFNLDTRIFLPG